MLSPNAEVQAGDCGLQEAAHARAAKPTCTDADGQYPEDLPQGGVREGASDDHVAAAEIANSGSPLGN